MVQRLKRDSLHTADVFYFAAQLATDLFAKDF